jgi:hypothetical protein
VRAAWRVYARTGYELTDNDLARMRERIQEALEPIAADYLADMSVVPEYFIPGPFSVPQQDTDTTA